MATVRNAEGSVTKQLVRFRCCLGREYEVVVVLEHPHAWIVTWLVRSGDRVDQAGISAGTRFSCFAK